MIGANEKIDQGPYENRAESPELVVGRTTLAHTDDGYTSASHPLRCMFWPTML